MESTLSSDICRLMLPPAMLLALMTFEPARGATVAEHGFVEQRRYPKVIHRLMHEKTAFKLVCATIIRAADRRYRMSIGHLVTSPAQAPERPNSAKTPPQSTLPTTRSPSPLISRTPITHAGAMPTEHCGCQLINATGADTKLTFAGAAALRGKPIISPGNARSPEVRYGPSRGLSLTMKSFVPTRVMHNCWNQAARSMCTSTLAGLLTLVAPPPPLFLSAYKGSGRNAAFLLKWPLF